MAKRETFKVENQLDLYVNMEIGKRMSATGVKVRKSDIIAEIARHANVGWDNINMIKRGINTPSLPVALKIAEYFDARVEDIFKIS